MVYPFVLVGTAVALFTFILARVRKEAGLYVWFAGTVAAVLGFGAFALQSVTPAIVGFVLSNVLIVLYQLLLATGLRFRLGVKTTIPRRYWLWLGLAIAGFGIATLYVDSYTARAFLASVLLIVAALEFPVVMHESEHRIPKGLRQFVWVVTGAYGTAHLVRIVLLFMLGAGRPATVFGGLFGFFTLSFTLFHFVLSAMLTLTIDVARLMDDLEQKNRTLEALATRDSLTGLGNRRTLDDNVANEIQRADRYTQPLTVILFDIDHFKKVNDTWGHATGDDVLRTLARVTNDIVRQPDNLFRWGGEEFLLLAPHTPLVGGVALAEKLRLAIASEDFGVAGQITASFGVAEWHLGESAAEMFGRADKALYRAKNAGRNKVVSAGPADVMPIAHIRISWRSEWNSGNDVIDGQHKTLLDMANSLFDLSMSMAEIPDMLAAIDRLINHVATHFADEEAFLAETGYPEREQHARLHAELVHAGLALREKVADGTAESGTLFDFLVDRVVIGHMMKADTLFFGYTRQKAADMRTAEAGREACS